MLSSRAGNVENITKSSFKKKDKNKCYRIMFYVKHLKNNQIF